MNLSIHPKKVFFKGCKYLKKTLFKILQHVFFQVFFQIFFSFSLFTTQVFFQIFFSFSLFTTQVFFQVFLLKRLFLTSTIQSDPNPKYDQILKTPRRHDTCKVLRAPAFDACMSCTVPECSCLIALLLFGLLLLVCCCWFAAVWFAAV